MKNKLKIITFLVTLLSFIPFTVNAATGKINLVPSVRQISTGNSVTVTVTCSSTTPIGGCEYTIDYDSSKLKLTSGEPTVVEAGNGKTKTITKKYTFKAIGNGSAKVSVKSYTIADWDKNVALKTTISPTTITISNAKPTKEPNKEYSTNNYLKSLSVEGQKLSPTFNKKTNDYKVSLDSNIEKIKINATKEDQAATVTGTGEVKVSEGENKFKIIVTSEKGEKRTYTITATVEDKNPIKVTVDGLEYTLIKKESALPELDTYTKKEITINDAKIPALYNETTNFTLVGLKSQDGTVSLFIYNETDNTYTPYNEIKVDGLRFYPITTDKKLEGYIETEIEINDLKIKCFKIDKNSKYAIIYGMNVETGETGFYSYEETENTLQKYTDENTKKYEEKLKQQEQFIKLLGAVILFLCILLIIVASIKTKKKSKKKKDQRIDNELRKTIEEEEQQEKKKKKIKPEKQLDEW